MFRDLLALIVTTLIIVFFMLLNDLYNPNIEINNFLSFIFTFESLFLTLTFGILFFIFFIPTAYLIEHKLKAQTRITQVVLFLLIGVITVPVISLMLHRKISFDLNLTLLIVVAFPLFGFLRTIKLNKYHL
ncbi:hypothetical protein AAV98_00145 [Bacillus sp. CHD6a]|nr:hypothetical protein AAV98_00145 [Bacillus sp. CHD6a]